MSNLWKFVHQKRNREVLGWLGGGLVVAATGLWVAVVYFFPPLKPADKMPISAQADCGSIVVGRDVVGGNLTAGTTTKSDCSSKPK